MARLIFPGITFEMHIDVKIVAAYEIIKLTLFGPGGGGGGGGSADFNLREIPCYLNNTYKTLPFLLKFIGEQDSRKRFWQGYKLLPLQPDFPLHV